MKNETLRQRQAVIVKPFEISPGKYDLSVNEYDYPANSKDELDFLRKAVGGSIEHLHIAEKLDEVHIDCYINESGKLKNLKPSFIFLDINDKLIDVIAGPVIFCTYDNQGNNYGMNELQLSYFWKWLEGLRVATLSSGSNEKSKVYCIDLNYDFDKVMEKWDSITKEK